jgi:photosystem II stability/assembly factor-like uncharacterized protein
MRPKFICLALLGVLSLSLPSLAAAVPAGSTDTLAGLFQNLKWRQIGPACFGGRIDDIEAVAGDPKIIFVAAASGGIFKSVNNGLTWKPVFDEEGTSLSIGDLAIAPSDPNIVWAGTGEPNSRQSSSWGDGVFRSADGGKTFQCMGLRDTHHIGRIVIHPTNPDVVYVAALGHLWGPNKERGLFRTMDGGETWTNAKFINEDTGFVDVAMDFENPQTLYAAAYQRRRTAYGFNGGGPGGGLFKTTDEGETWVRLTNGLPEGDFGRIGIDIYRSNPGIVYATIEHKNGGVFRSEDKGFTWKRMSSTNPRPMYYSKIRIDPNNDQRIWVLGESMYFSEDGGKTFRTDLMSRFPRKEYRVHGDHHAMWINPQNSNHMIIGSDGGIYITYDGGISCDLVNTIPLGQVYEISFDMQRPYFVNAGLQDNGTWHGPSATWFRQSITNEEWFKIGGADGFYNQVDPRDHTLIYTSTQNGGISLFNLQNFEQKSLKPEPKVPQDSFAFNWNSPFLISPHSPDIIYLGGNRLFISRNKGDTWEATIDLTTAQNRDKLPIMGVLPDENTLSKHDGVTFFGTITTISESPVKPGLLWVGTDDGNLQISRDSGRNWRNVISQVKGVPKNTYVSRVVASWKEEGTVYVTFDGHQNDDFTPYVLVSVDYGENWINLSANLSYGGTVNVIREHPQNHNLLFVGTERGAYFSVDRGKAWTKFKNDFPIVPVDDIAIHPRENDLILGTHGRSIWILDDVTPLAQLTTEVLSSPLFLFDIRAAIIFNPYRLWMNYDIKGPVGHRLFEAPNPPQGAIINYFLKERMNGRVKVIIEDSTGRAIRELDIPQEAGIHRIIWDLGYGPPNYPARGEMGEPPLVLPGEYKVKLSRSGQELTKTVDVQSDPRTDVPFEERVAQHDALLRIYRLSPLLAAAIQTTNHLKELIDIQKNNIKELSDVPDSIHRQVAAIANEIETIRMTLSRDRAQIDQQSWPPIRNELRTLYASIGRYTQAPSERKTLKIGELTGALKEIVQKINRIIEADIPALNKLLNEKDIPRILPGETIKVSPNR